jgi:hypothetical protein
MQCMLEIVRIDTRSRERIANSIEDAPEEADLELPDPAPNPFSGDMLM